MVKRKLSSSRENNKKSLLVPVQPRTKNIVWLEEQGKLEEVVLQALIERRNLIVKELETIRVQRKHRDERLVDLRERTEQLHDASVKHVTLQNDLQDSLVKSRERLGRLTSLEAEEEGGGGMEVVAHLDLEGDAAQSPYGIEEIQKMYGIEGEADAQPLAKVGPVEETNESNSTPEEADSHTSNDETINQSVSISKETTDDQEFPNSKINLLSVPLQSIRTLDCLKRFTGQHHPMSLLSFLPALQRKEIERVLTISIREANALDAQEDDSARRGLLWNTCLDFGALSRKVQPELPSKFAANEATNNTPLLVPMDPNVSLCPYDLAGVCADDWCPYQHTSKLTLARERLPLPSLKLSIKEPVSNDKHGARKKPVAQEQTDNKTGEVEIGSALSSIDGDQYATMEIGETCSADEEDFISLPAPTKDDEEQEKNEDDQLDEDEDEQHDPFVSAYLKENQLASSWSFWWGGTWKSTMSSLTEILEEVGGISVEEGDISSDPIASDTQWMGCLVDMSRMSVHSGRFDIANSLLELSSKRSVAQAQSQLLTNITKQLHQLETVAFEFNGQPHSFFCASFATQSSLAILSEYARAVEICKKEDGDWQKSLDSFQDIALECINSFSLEPPDVVSESNDNVVDVFRKMLSISDDEWDDSSLSSGKGAVRRFGDLHLSLLWAQRSFQVQSQHLKSLQCIDDKVLKPCWSLVRNWLRKLKPASRHWECIKATILMGYVILGCLERFAAEVSHGQDELSFSLTAALTSVDATVHRILKGLSKDLADVPMIDLILTPLFAASVSTAAFLRLYASSQNRLENLLVLNPNKRKDSKSPALSSLSELLWSQLCHLRTTLPIESVVQPQHGKNPFRWELSNEVITDNILLLDRIEELGVHLHHLTLHGDWILARAMSNEKMSPPHQLEPHQRKSLQKVSLDLLKMILQDEKEDDSDTTLQLRNVQLCSRKDGRGRVPSPFLSTLPRSILLAGSSLKTLRLVRCNLSVLPVSFGLCFPNLTSLNFSGNQLTELPISFRSLAQLERLWVNNNQLKLLSEDVLVSKLKLLFCTHNSLESFPSLSLANRCPQLEEIGLSHNCLETLSDLELSDWTFRLKHLRVLEFKPQRPAMEEIESSTNIE